jgi:hypothetical protein
MNLEQAIEHLKSNKWLQSDGTLYSLGTYIYVDEQTLTIDGSYFTTKDLMAIAVYCESKGWHTE